MFVLMEYLDEDLKNFIWDLGKEGFVLQLVSLAGLHLNAAAAASIQPHGHCPVKAIRQRNIALSLLSRLSRLSRFLLSHRLLSSLLIRRHSPTHPRPASLTAILPTLLLLQHTETHSVVTAPEF